MIEWISNVGINEGSRSIFLGREKKEEGDKTRMNLSTLLYHQNHTTQGYIKSGGQKIFFICIDAPPQATKIQHTTHMHNMGLYLVMWPVRSDFELEWKSDVLMWVTFSQVIKRVCWSKSMMVVFLNLFCFSTENKISVCFTLVAFLVLGTCSYSFSDAFIKKMPVSGTMMKNFAHVTKFFLQWYFPTLTTKV